MASKSEIDPETGTDQPSTRDCGIPEWATQPFKTLRDQIERQAQLLHLSIRGISGLQELPDLAEALWNVNDNTQDSFARERIELVKREADLAKREVEEGFPLLHAYAGLALWSSFEAAFRLFVVRWLQNKKGALEVDVLQKLRVKIGEYECLQGEDRYFYILDRLEQEISAPLRSGITKFEKILEPFGLSGRVDDSIQRDLFELNQVRNVLMHRGGKADRRLLEACPWLGLVAGQAVVIDHLTIERYTQSVTLYSFEIMARIGENFGSSFLRSKLLEIRP